jgi:hypothetical protein
MHKMASTVAGVRAHLAGNGEEFGFVEIHNLILIGLNADDREGDLPIRRNKHEVLADEAHQVIHCAVFLPAY